MPSPNSLTGPAEDEIRLVAYCIWSDTGRLPGNELENWIAAREILRCLHAGLDEPDTGGDERQRGRDPPDALVTLVGEVVDLACYLARGAHGPAHAACARRCIARGLPVGLRAEDGNVRVATSGVV